MSSFGGYLLWEQETMKCAMKYTMKYAMKYTMKYAMKYTMKYAFCNNMVVLSPDSLSVCLQGEAGRRGGGEAGMVPGTQPKRRTHQ